MHAGQIVFIAIVADPRGVRIARHHRRRVVKQAQTNLGIACDARHQRGQQIQRIAGVADIEHIAGVVQGFRRLGFGGNLGFAQPPTGAVSQM
ncbi:hypothetical protein D3C80_1925070 [compost metagenome]